MNRSIRNKRARKLRMAAMRSDQERVGKISLPAPYFSTEVTAPNPLKDPRLGETSCVIITLSPNGERAVVV